MTTNTTKIKPFAKLTDVYVAVLAKAARVERRTLSDFIKVATDERAKQRKENSE